MNTKWIIETHGDPLGALRRFIRAVWRQSQLDGLLAPLDGAETTHARPRVLDDPGQLDQVNPFKPLMVMNAARLAPRLLRDQPRARLGALLRPFCSRTTLTVSHNRRGKKMQTDHIF